MTSNSEEQSKLTADLKSYSSVTDKLRALTPDSDWVSNDYKNYGAGSLIINVSIRSDIWVPISPDKSVI